MVRNLESQLIALETTVASEMSNTNARVLIKNHSGSRANSPLGPIGNRIDEDPSRIRSYSFITRDCNLPKPQGLILAL